MIRRHTDAQLSEALRILPNVCAVAEALGLDLRGLTRRIDRMRKRGAWTPAPWAGKRRWARRSEA